MAAPQSPAQREILRQQNNSQQEWNRRQYRAAFTLLKTLCVCGLVLAAPLFWPNSYTGIVLGTFPAIYMSGYLYLSPNSLRSRNGSLSTARFLVAFLWLVALGTAAAYVSGTIE